MLARALSNRFGDAATTLARAELDITDAEAVARAVAGFDAVINAAAYTAVDDAETHEDDAFAINALGASNVARACAMHGARLVHVSTDYVFDGTAAGPYAEDAPTNPISAYGRTKLAGERAVINAHPSGTTIVRTAWLYGAGGKNFVATMLDRAAAGAPVSVVDDQHGQPTWTHDLAGRIADLIDVGPGVYHCTNSGRCSWFDLAVAVYSAAGADPALVTRTTSAEFSRPAPRPTNSVLSDDAALAAGLSPMRAWDVALADALRVDFGL
jgi:dTDP-4-dehydrorhamnose reductase